MKSIRLGNGMKLGKGDLEKALSEADKVVYN